MNQTIYLWKCFNEITSLVAHFCTFSMASTSPFLPRWELNPRTRTGANFPSARTTQVKRQSSLILVTECWAWSWFWCTVSPQVTFYVIPVPVVGCHYFPPGLWSPSQPKNVTVLRPVPSYTAWWQRHIGVNNFPKVVTQLASVGIEPTTYWSQVHRPTATALCYPSYPLNLRSDVTLYVYIILIV